MVFSPPQQSETDKIHIRIFRHTLELYLTDAVENDARVAQRQSSALVMRRSWVRFPPRALYHAIIGV